MIDTLHIVLPAETVTLPSLEGVRYIHSDYGQTIQGHHRNLRVNQTSNTIRIQGSLQKWYRGDNFGNLQYQDDSKAISDLCHTFSFEPNEATLRRLDFGANISTTFRPSAYFPYLGRSQNYYRTDYRNTVNYINSVRTISVYQKDTRTLRFETRYKKPEKSLKRVIALADLLTPEVYDFFLQRWREEFYRIEKLNEIIPLENMKPDNLLDFLAAVGLQEIGPEPIRNHIKSAQRTGAIDKHKAKRFRDKIDSLLNDPRLAKPNELIQELNEKITKCAA